MPKPRLIKKVEPSYAEALKKADLATREIIAKQLENELLKEKGIRAYCVTTITTCLKFYVQLLSAAGLGKDKSYFIRWDFKTDDLDIDETLYRENLKKAAKALEFGEWRTGQELRKLFPEDVIQKMDS